LKILIAGYGSIGRRHLRNLAALGITELIVYHTGHSTLPQDELKGIKVETDLNQALEHQPDAVIIANPTALHMDIAIPAATAGCHLFIEKPVSNNLERIGILKSLLLRKQKHTLVGFQYRFHPGLQTIKRLVTNGAIGRPLEAHAHWGEYLPNWHPWEDYRLSYSARSDLGGGVALTLCHPLDYLRWIIGEVENIWAFTGKISDLEIQVDDTAEICMLYRVGSGKAPGNSSGVAIGSVHLNYHQQPTLHKMSISGTQGTLQWDNSDGAVHLYNQSGTPSEVFPLKPGFERNDMFIAEMQHFLDVIQGKAQPVCSLEDGERIQRIIEAAYSSSQSGKRISI
jgi:predicted dehydrogenase